MTDYDVLIIGAGLSGIGMACHLAKECPNLSVSILERRQAIGGTWDLFRYPGIRSDADMFTFGYAFRPWRSLKTLADGASIQSYITDTASEYGIQKKIQFGIRTINASWSSSHRRWTVQTQDEAGGPSRSITCKFLIPCTGYYNHDEGYLPQFPGRDRFKGAFVHPQHWPEDLVYQGKRAVVIGSGATAISLVPAMAMEGAHVTLLQRSPSYIINLPGLDKLSGSLRRFLPDRWVYSLARQRNIWLQVAMYKAAKRWPEQVRKMLLTKVSKQVGPNIDMRHFTPRYMPWEERLCAVPDGDLFRVLRKGKASIVTDQIETFTENGIQLKSGEHLQADIIVSATGLNLQMLGGTQLCVDEKKVALNEIVTYKGVMGEGLPNIGWIFGHTNSPWTLKADLACQYLCRLLNFMAAHNYSTVMPRPAADERLSTNIMDNMQSGYVQRGNDVLPRQGRRGPWRVLNDYAIDRKVLLRQPIEDSALLFDSIPSFEETPTSFEKPVITH